MAYIQNQDEELNQQGKAGGTVLAGSGGAGSATPTQAVGTGFTNLQKYLTANQGSGSGLANDMIAQGQKAVDAQMQTANQAASSWGDEGVTAVNKAGADQSAQLQQAIDYTNTGASDYIDKTASARAMKYQDAGAVPPPNTLDKNYANVAEAARLYGTDFNTQKSGLQQKYGYGGGFASLDAFLGKQDGKAKLGNWQNNVTSSLKNDQGVYRGIADQQARVNQANQTNATGFSDLQSYLNKTVADRKKAEADAMKAAAGRAIAEGKGLHGGPQTQPKPTEDEPNPRYWDRPTYRQR